MASKDNDPKGHGKGHENHGNGNGKGHEHHNHGGTENPPEQESCLTVRMDQVLFNPTVHLFPDQTGLTVIEGERPPEFGWVRITYDNPHPTSNELDWQSSLTKMEVFDKDGNLMGVAKIESSIHGGLSVGDQYLKFTVTGGPDWLPQDTTIIITNQSFANLPAPLQYGNGAFDMKGCNCGVPCFTAECRVMTEHGDPVRVADLIVGDAIAIQNHHGDVEYHPIQFISRYRTSDPDQRPIRIHGNEIFSQQHRFPFTIRGERVWCRAKFLVELGLAEELEHLVQGDMPYTEYYHILMHKHCEIVGETVNSESVLITEYSLSTFPDDVREDLLDTIDAVGLDRAVLGELDRRELQRKDLKALHPMKEMLRRQLAFSRKGTAVES